MQELSNPTPKNEVLPCLLIPIQGGRMVLPNVTVAELIPFQKPSDIANSPEWILGEIEWRGTMIPVISYEEFSGFKKGPAGQDLRVAVVNSPNGEQGKMRFSFDTTPLAAGTYMLDIRTEKGLVLNKKLVKVGN